MLIFCILSLLFHPYGVLLIDYLIRGSRPCLWYSTPDGGYFNAFKVLFSDFLGLKYPKFMLFFAQTAQNGKFLPL